MTEPWLQPLAAWCAGPVPARLAADERGRVAMAALDWLGALAAGRGEEAAPRYAAVYGAMDAGGSSATDRAFHFGGLSHLAEVDDGHRAATLHPGVVTFAPIMALARQRGASLANLRAAVVAGYEASVRLGQAFGPAHYRTFHSTGTAGAFGAAAAAARLLGLEGPATLHAFGHAGTQAAGLWQFADDGAAEAKAAHAGLAARAGLTAALMAGAGLRGAERILEGERGLAVAWGAPIDRAPLSRYLGAPTALSTATVKGSPVCGQMHHVLDALRDAGLSGSVRPGKVRAVEIESFEALERVAGARDPATVAEARFSTPWCVAWLLLRGEVGFALFRDPGVLEDVEVRALAARVSLVTRAEYTAGFPTRRACRITIETAEGTREVTGQGRRGDPERPFSRDEMLTRFEDIAAGTRAGWRAAALTFVARLEQEEDGWMTPEEIAELVDDPS